MSIHARRFSQLHEKTQEDIATWKRIPLIFTLLLALCLLACNPQAVTMPPTIVPGSPTSSTSPVPLVVYAQPDFTTRTLYPTGQNTLNNAGYITIDSHGGFYIADYNNNRVLHFPASTRPGAGPQADQVYGQPDYTSNAPHSGPAGLNRPHGIAVDPNGGLYISDMLNNRVLHYPAGSTIADRVYGQTSFTANQSNPAGPGARSLYHPQGLAIGSTGLYVSDSSNNRVLHYPTGSTTADFVYGQGTPGNASANFTSNTSGSGATGLNNPRDVAVDSTGLYVADSGNHRVLHYMLGNPTADRVYGQPDLTATSVRPNQGRDIPTAATLNNPTMIALDKTSGFYIADRNNNRILYYPPSAQSGGIDPPALRVYGQKSYSSRNSSTTATTFNGPGAVAVDALGNVFVLDIFNQRVLKFLTGLHISGQPPAHIAKGATLDMSVDLQDIGSGITFTDFTGQVIVRIKSGTGRAGAILKGITAVHAVSGVVVFRGLSINQPGSGYTLTCSTHGYAPADTIPFSIGA